MRENEAKPARTNNHLNKLCRLEKRKKLRTRMKQKQKVNIHIYIKKQLMRHLDQNILKVHQGYLV